jgi:hypothetical protein
MAEEYGLLPDNHFGGRKGQGTDTALHAVVETIQNAWKTGKIVTILLLDISGAFDNVSHLRLVHNLRKRRMPECLVNWVASFLAERYTTLELPDYHRPRARVRTGIPQGSPISPILYLFYNADMMGEKEFTSNLGYIDDTSVIAIGDTEAENCHLLAASFEECERWATTHASVFAPEKFALVHFHRPQYYTRRTPPNSGTELDQDPVEQAINNHTLNLGNGRVVTPSKSAKLLGVILDTHLRFDDHLAQIDKQCTRSIQAVTGLGRSGWGLLPDQRKLIYEACIAPKAMYAASVWAMPDVYGKKSARKRQMQQLNAIQRRAAHSIGGTFRTVSATAMNTILHLQPMEQRIQEALWKGLSRLATSRIYANIIRQRVHHVKQSYHSNLEIAEEAFLLRANYDPDDFETRLPFAVPPW